MAKVTMPQLGESVAEGTIGKWLKQPGDTVEKYEPLLEVITDKVNAEVPSPFAGVLKEILAEEGATVPNNAEIAVIETQEEAGGASRRARRGEGGRRRPIPMVAPRRSRHRQQLRLPNPGPTGRPLPLPLRRLRPNDRNAPLPRPHQRPRPPRPRPPRPRPRPATPMHA